MRYLTDAILNRMAFKSPIIKKSDSKLAQYQELALKLIRNLPVDSTHLLFIKELYLQDCGIHSLKPLTQLSELEILHASNNHIVSVSDVDGLEKLRIL